jgi:hypothetical protein
MEKIPPYGSFKKYIFAKKQLLASANSILKKYVG